jgi:hypothetical protein
VGAGKLADLAPAGQGRAGAVRRQRPPAEPAGVAPCIPDAARSAEQSFGALELYGAPPSAGAPVPLARSVDLPPEPGAVADVGEPPAVQHALAAALPPAEELGSAEARPPRMATEVWVPDAPAGQVPQFSAAEPQKA